MPAKIYSRSDIRPDVLNGKRIAIIGYGNQGHAHALNLRDSGLDVIVSNRPGSENFKKAVADGFQPLSASEAARQADIIQVLTQDELMAQVYKDEIAPNLTSGKSLLFAHGFNILYKLIVPPPDVDVALVSPKGVGKMLRRLYTEGRGLPALIAVHQDATGSARDIALAYADGIGSSRAGIIETTFKEETECDLFGEQAVLCGGATALVQAGFETLVEAGYQPEVAYFECLHELKLIVDLVHEGGIAWMRKCISNTAEFGDYTRGPRIIDESAREKMRQILTEIQSGEFAGEWIHENQTNQPVLNASRSSNNNLLVDTVGDKMRKMMPWLKKF
ncbi:MAG: ketol-acid reductoisomerase [Armatimonadota bacterium]